MKSNAEINKSLHTKMGRCWHEGPFLLSKDKVLVFKCKHCANDLVSNPDYTSDSSPRSLLAEVEAEIERRGKIQDYALILCAMINRCECDEFKKQCIPQQYLSLIVASAEEKARAAEEVL